MTDDDANPFERLLGTMPNICSLSFGRVVEAEPRAVDRFGSPKLKRIAAVFRFTEQGFGFGEVVIAVDPETGQHYIDAETMSKEHVKKLLGWLVDSAIMDTEDEPEKHRAYDAFMGRRCGQCPAPPSSTDDPAKA